MDVNIGNYDCQFSIHIIKNIQIRIRNFSKNSFPIQICIPPDRKFHICFRIKKDIDVNILGYIRIRLHP